VVQPIEALAQAVIDQLLALIGGGAPASICLPCHIRPGDSIALTWSIPHEKVR
jgi:DNA-binding LacI/PurR family transcriptional regulator